MNSFSTEYNNTILENVSKLNHQWFLEKERSFKSHPGYDSNTQKIIIKLKDRIYTGTYDSEGIETGNEYEDNSTELNIDLVNYCSSFLPLKEETEWGFSPFIIDPKKGTQLLSNNIPEFAATLVSDIELSEGRKDIVVVSKFVSVTLERIEKECDILKSNSPSNVDYADVLRNFLKECSSRLFNTFKNELALFELTNDYTDKLDFNLSQEEMVSLFFILAKAGILKHGEYEYDSFLKFCLKYFTVHKKVENHRVTNTKGFIDSYRKILSNKNGKGLSEIKRKLEQVLKGIV